MKKLLFLLAIPIYFFTITSCNDNGSKTETTAVDSTKTDSTVQVTTNCASGDSSQIVYWQIDETIAMAMINNNGPLRHSSHIKYDRDHIFKKIKDSFPGGAKMEDARYRDVDVERYRTKRCIAATDSAGMVTQYFTKIVKVKAKVKDAKGAFTASYTYYYYDIATICPPPDGACDVQKQDSTKK